MPRSTRTGPPSPGPRAGSKRPVIDKASLKRFLGRLAKVNVEGYLPERGHAERFNRHRLGEDELMIAARYTRAREIGFTLMAEEIIEISDNAMGDLVDGRARTAIR